MIDYYSKGMMYIVIYFYSTMKIAQNEYDGLNWATGLCIMKVTVAKITWEDGNMLRGKLFMAFLAMLYIARNVCWKFRFWDWTVFKGDIKAFISVQNDIYLTFDHSTILGQPTCCRACWK